MTKRNGNEAAAPGMKRRDFLRVTTTMAAGAGLAAAGCQNPPESLVPFHERPEGLRTLGRPLYYATVLDGVPCVARNREGRPILIAPNPEHPSRTTLTLGTQAALLDLYDADRARGPLSVRRGQGTPVASSWAAVSAQVVRALGESRGKSVLLVRPIRGKATRAAVIEAARSLDMRIVEYEPFQADSRIQAWKTCFGNDLPHIPRMERAALIVGFGAEFLDNPELSVESDFAARRVPDHADGMSRFVAFEGRLSLTGANADRRFRVRDSHLAATALALLHELAIRRGIGPLSDSGDTTRALAPFSIQAVAPLVGLPADALQALAGEMASAGPRTLVMGGGTASSSTTGLALETAVLLLNHTLGAIGTTLVPAGDFPPAHGGLAALAALADDLRSDKVDLLLVAGPNPAFDSPAALRFAEAASRVRLFVSLNDRLDETSLLADLLAPASHPFECWGDSDFPGNLHSIQQPLIRPLHDTHGLLDLVLSWAADAGTGGDIAAAVDAARPDPEGDLPANSSPAWHWLRNWWGRNLLMQDPSTTAFRDAWEESLRRGFHAGEPPIPLGLPDPDRSSLAVLASAMPAPTTSLEAHLHPSFTLNDGRRANNGWLQELPDPLTRITWGNWAGLAPRRFDQMGLKNGDLVEVRAGDVGVTLPAFRHAGLHHDVVSIPLGCGRTACGKVGDGIGHNAFPLLPVADGRLVRSGIAVQVLRASGHEEPAITQGAEVLDRKPRPLVPVATLTEFQAQPNAGTRQVPGGPSLWPDHEYAKQRWAMTIDLSRCTGCGKCVLGCQAENNIPVVGRKDVIQGREMAWIRIDRYWDAGRDRDWGDEVWDGPLDVVEEPFTLFQPMLCQHCENAPCETVCPFVATMHSEDGLNQQVYNRCVGTRYCANNCPFKVRRFNWFEYGIARESTLARFLIPQIARHGTLNARGPLPLKNNPEVTVRSRGVMEKCSFCVQRIREARAQATREGRAGKIADGEVRTACMDACPTNAIVFGNANDMGAKVRASADSPRAMFMLEYLGVKPSIAYLTKVRNDDGQV
jgi:molybdopterin-containing oxidoreductase family iron-sulfur binding subunit